MPKLVYIAGPYTTPDPVENTHRTAHFATALFKQHNGHWIPLVPHLTMLWHAITPMPYESWLEIDLVHMSACQAVIRLTGASSGADKELAHAQKIGIPTLELVNADLRGSLVEAADWLASHAG